MSSPVHRSALGPCPLCSFECSSVVARGAQRLPQIGDFISCGQCLAPLKVSATGLTTLTEAERDEFLQLAQRVVGSAAPRRRAAARCTALAPGLALAPRCELEQGHSAAHAAWGITSAERLSW